MTECTQETFAFTAHFSRRVEAGFSAGQVCSDGGAPLLREGSQRDPWKGTRMSSRSFVTTFRPHTCIYWQWATRSIQRTIDMSSVALGSSRSTNIMGSSSVRSPFPPSWMTL